MQRDAKDLALALRAGTLQFVRIPAVEEEEVRGLVRCRSAPAFMKFTGLTPSEYSSGDRIRRGKITKAGNSHIRHVLVEAVQRAYSSVQPGKFVLRRWQGVSGPLRQIAVDCAKRLHHKFWSMARRGISAGKIRVAVARELAGFVWALMTHPGCHEAPPTA